MDTPAKHTTATGAGLSPGGLNVRLQPGRVPFDFTAVVERYETPLLRDAGQMLGPDREAAEEAVQETFLRLHRQVRDHGEASVDNVASWLFRVAHNLSISVLRKRELGRKAQEQTAGRHTGEMPAVEPADALDALVRKEMCRKALDELQALPPEFRQVVLLKVIQGFSFREIGEITGLSVSNVSYRLNRALGEMARRLKAAGLV